MSGNPNGLKDDLRESGYSQEEMYFYELNRELIESRRRRLDLARARAREEHEKKAHWMKCPKCGSALQETSVLGICIDQCTACRGVFVDAGEFETLVATRQPKSIYGRLQALLTPKEGEPTLF